jgi:hypothetical protein
MSNVNQSKDIHPTGYFLVKNAAGSADGIDYNIADGYHCLTRAIQQGVPGNIAVTVNNPVTKALVTKIIPGGNFPAGSTFLVQAESILDANTTAAPIIIYFDSKRVVAS